jgi:HNH endonuclease
MDVVIIIDEPNISEKAKPIKCLVTDNGCWECISHALDSQGKYPVITRGNRYWRLNRYIYTLYKGEIPKGHVVMHICDNPKCVNPAHLKTGTPKENSMDMVIKGRQAKGVKNGGGVKLDEEKVRAIRKDTRSLQAIADHYGISKKLVLNVKQRKNWRHIDD